MPSVAVLTWLSLRFGAHAVTICPSASVHGPGAVRQSAPRGLLLMLRRPCAFHGQAQAAVRTPSARLLLEIPQPRLNRCAPINAHLSYARHRWAPALLLPAGERPGVSMEIAREFLSRDVSSREDP